MPRVPLIHVGVMLFIAMFVGQCRPVEASLKRSASHPLGFKSFSRDSVSQKTISSTTLDTITHPLQSTTIRPLSPSRRASVQLQHASNSASHGPLSMLVAPQHPEAHHALENLASTAPSIQQASSLGTKHITPLDYKSIENTPFKAILEAKMLVQRSNPPTLPEALFLYEKLVSFGITGENLSNSIVLDAYEVTPTVIRNLAKLYILAVGQPDAGAFLYRVFHVPNHAVVRLGFVLHGYNSEYHFLSVPIVEPNPYDNCPGIKYFSPYNHLAMIECTPATWIFARRYGIDAVYQPSQRWEIHSVTELVNHPSKMALPRHELMKQFVQLLLVPEPGSKEASPYRGYWGYVKFGRDFDFHGFIEALMERGWSGLSINVIHATKDWVLDEAYQNGVALTPKERLFLI